MHQLTKQQRCLIVATKLYSCIKVKMAMDISADYNKESNSNNDSRSNSNFWKVEAEVGKERKVHGGRGREDESRRALEEDGGAQEEGGEEGGGSKKSCNLYKVVEVLLLGVVMLVLLGLYMIPTFYYLRPPLESRPVSSCTLHTVSKHYTAGECIVTINFSLLGIIL